MHVYMGPVARMSTFVSIIRYIINLQERSEMGG